LPTLLLKETEAMIKIEFSGTGEEVRVEMLKLLGLNEPKASIESKKLTEDKPVAEIKSKATKRNTRQRNRKTGLAWNEKEVTKLFQAIKPNAQKILLELAKKPEGYPRKDLLQALGLEERSAKGQLSSIGAALRRMGGKPSPISRNKKDGELTYGLDTIVAEVLNRNN